MRTPNRPWLAHYDPGVLESLAPYPDQPAYTFLEKSASTFPHRACTIFKGQRISYQEMNRLVDKVAAALGGLGLQKGERVGLILPNLPQFVACFYGILKAGGVVIPQNSLYTSEELAYQWKDACPKIVIALSNSYGKLKQAQSGTTVDKIILTSPVEALPPHLAWLFRLFRERRDGYRVELEPEDIWLNDLLSRTNDDQPEAVEVHANDLALIQYTGGTTGLPKGAMVCHRSLVVNTLQLRNWLRSIRDGEEVTLMALPLFHSYGLMVGLSLSICAASTLVMIPDPRDIQDLLQNALRYQATALPGVPTLFRAIANDPHVRSRRWDLHHLRLLVSGGSALPKSIKEDFEQYSGGPLLEGYGLTETLTVTHANPFQGEYRVGSIGLPLPDVDCRMISLEDEMSALPPGEIGELAICSPQVFQGYWNREKETAEAFRILPGEDQPWLFTGDIGYMDADGYFYLIDRKKEMIKASGFQVLPSEVEKVILEHPKVKQVCIAGVPDPYRGETVKAWIVLQPGEKASPEEIRNFCETRLAAYKIPAWYEFRDQLPMNLLGKVLRRQLIQEHNDHKKDG
jgi:long-chain acyl-CoA synthetase